MAQSAEYPDLPYVGPPMHYRSGRPGTPKWVVIHNTSNARLASAEAEASYATHRPDSVSSHYYCDRDSLVHSLRTSDTAFHAGGNPGNPYGIAYEVTGQNGLSRDWWLANVAWDLLARQVGRDCLKYAIPVRYVTAAGLARGDKGITTHNDCRLAWGGTDHTDPGPGWPMDHLLALVRAHLEGSGAVAVDDDIWRLVHDGLRPGQNQTVGGVPIAWLPKQFFELDGAVARLTTDVAELKARPPVAAAPVDPATLKAVLLDPEVLAAIARAVADEDHRRSES